MNLFLYLPPHSAQPPETLKGLIFGSFDRYWRQNSSIDDFSVAVNKLYVNLRKRGYENKELNEEFLEAAKNIDKKKQDCRRK